MTAPVFDPYAALARIRAALSTDDGELSQAPADAGTAANPLPVHESARSAADFSSLSSFSRGAGLTLRQTKRPDWRALFAERLQAALDARQPDATARRNAWETCIVRWLDQRPVTSDPDAGCIACGRFDLPGDILLPFGTGPHAWLHSRCWPDWYAARRAEAAAALAAHGIPSPTEHNP